MFYLVDTKQPSNEVFNSYINMRFTCLIDNSHDRLNFDSGNTNKIFHYNWKEHTKISKIGNFGGKML